MDLCNTRGRQKGAELTIDTRAGDAALDMRSSATPNAQTSVPDTANTARSGDLGTEARERAEQEWASRWIQQGDAWTTQADQGNFLFQVKRRSANVIAESLSEADRLNGVEWSGVVNFDVAAHRIYHFEGETGFMGAGRHAQGWGDWESPGGSPF